MSFRHFLFRFLAIYVYRDTILRPKIFSSLIPSFILHKLYVNIKKMTKRKKKTYTKITQIVYSKRILNKCSHEITSFINWLLFYHCVYVCLCPVRIRILCILLLLLLLKVFSSSLAAVCNIHKE